MFFIQVIFYPQYEETPASNKKTIARWSLQCRRRDSDSRPGTDESPCQGFEGITRWA